jgi:outer membrane immunogenic protein
VTIRTFAVMLGALLVTSTVTLAPLQASTPEQIISRLDALEKEVATLRRENSALRQRVDRREAVSVPKQERETPIAATPIQPAVGPVGKVAAVQTLPPHSWTGLYAGVHLGAGWAPISWDRPLGFLGPTDECPQAPIVSCITAGSHNAIGLLGGGQIGFNYQTGSFLFGIEAQYSLASLNGSHNSSLHFSTDTGDDSFFTFGADGQYSSKITDIGTIAARVGLVSGPSDRTLFFVKGGAAYAKGVYKAELIGGGIGCDLGDVECNGVFISASTSGKHTRWGWMAGAGLEHDLGGNWSAKIEYNYLGFGTKTHKLKGNACAVGEIFGNPDCPLAVTQQFKIDQDVHLIKFGLNYRFGEIAGR